MLAKPRRATQSQQTEVQRRHETQRTTLSLFASSEVAQGRAVMLTGLKQGAHAQPGQAIGISLGAAKTGERFDVATAGQYVERGFWHWQAGPVFYDSVGRLHQGAGTNATQIAIATAATELLVIASSAVQAGGYVGGITEDAFTLTPQHIADRGVTLSAAPADPSKVEFVAYGGPEQRANVDFVVTGTSLSWAGLSLELLLQAGDAITVRFVSA